MGMAGRIKERRLAMGYTQEELANKLGLQKSAIAKYENGRVENIKRTVISHMADILECSPAYLMDWSDSIDGGENAAPPQTIAAHFDGDEYTDEELDKIKEFAAFVKASRK